MPPLLTRNISLNTAILGRTINPWKAPSLRVNFIDSNLREIDSFTDTYQYNFEYFLDRICVILLLLVGAIAENLRRQLDIFRH
jgi:hypothetical protein